MQKTFMMLLFILCAAGGISAQTKQLTLIGKESSISYVLVHPLHKVDAESKEFDCKVGADIGKKEITTVVARVDVMTFDSGNSNRDSHAMEVIDAITYPEASFTSTKVHQAGDSVKVEGKLTFHGVTRPVTIAASQAWSSTRLEIHGKFDISLTAFNVSRPSLLMIPTEDTLRFSLIAVFGF
jgi:polyisoprenoid-binding protein YceI